MKVRTLLLGAIALVALGLLPNRLSAQCSYTFSLGLGGSISGCYSGFITEVGEDAGYTSSQYFWTGNFGSVSGADNAPTVAGTFMFDDNCGSGGNGTFAFCTGGFLKPNVALNSTSGELVLALKVPDNTYGTPFDWIYSGSNVRNTVPAPLGFQEVMLQLTLGGVDDPGQFLYGWEDLNTGCISRATPNNSRYREEDLTNGTLLNSVLGNCTVILPGGDSDSDFNDSYMRFSITGTGIPLGTVPEPMTMSLMAIGLVGMGATSLRRRKK